MLVVSFTILAFGPFYPFSFVSHFQVYIMGIERIKKGGEVVGPFSRVGGALLCIDQNH